MKTRKKIDSIIAEMKDAKCSYPECEEKSAMHCGLPMLAELEGGKIEPSEGAAITVPFCMYHATLAMGGFMGVIQKPNGMMLHAPYKEIAIAEAVYYANEMKKNESEMRGKIKKETPKLDEFAKPRSDSKQ